MWAHRGTFNDDMVTLVNEQLLFKHCSAAAKISGLEYRPFKGLSRSPWIPSGFPNNTHGHYEQIDFNEGPFWRGAPPTAWPRITPNPTLPGSRVP